MKYENEEAQQSVVIAVLSGRRADLPPYIARRILCRLSRHRFVFRTPHGLIIWYEVWCDTEFVMGHMRQEANAVVERGFTVAFLGRRFSTRDTACRQPLLLVPREHKVSLDWVAETLDRLMPQP